MRKYWTPHFSLCTVFLDTTVFEGELFDFDSRHLRTICSLVEERAVEVIITDVTKREVEAHIGEAVHAAVRGLTNFRKEREHGVLRHFGEPFKFIYQKHDPVALATQLKAKFHAFLETVKAIVLSTDQLPVGPIMERYFSQRPPFSEGRKKSEFPDAIAAMALVAHGKKSKRPITLVSADKDWKKFSESDEGFEWWGSVAEFLQEYPDPAIADKIKHTLLNDDDFQEELRHRFSKVGYFVSEANGEVEDVSELQVKVKRPVVTEAKDGTAIADVWFWVSYHLKISYDIPNTGKWDPERKRITELDRGHVEFTQSTHMMSQVEMTYDVADPSIISVVDIFFEDDEVEIDINDILKEYEDDPDAF